MKHKKLKQTLALICTAMLFSSCDPEYYDELYFDNQSGYDILVEYSGWFRYYPSEYERGYNETYPTPNGKKTLVRIDGGVGCTGSYESKLRIFDFYGDSISFVIDSTRKITYYAYDTLSEDSPYNFNSSHYQHTYNEPTGNYFGCEASESSHTYTITAEQINSRLDVL